MKINIIYYLKFSGSRVCRVPIFIFILISTLSLNTDLSAQESSIPKGFQAELVGGVNLSQLDGDQLSGFNKLGLRGGLRLNYATSTQNGLGFGIFYDQRGSSTGIISGGGFNQHISLDYIALPISYYFDSWFFSDFNRHRMRFHISVIPARLVSTRSSHQSFDMATDDFKKWDISLAAGLRYALGRRTGIDIRIERSFLTIFQPIPGQSSSLQSYLISFQFAHLLNQL